MKIPHNPDYRQKRRDLYEARGLSPADVLDAILSDLNPDALGPNGKPVRASRRAVKTAVPKTPTKD